MSEHKFLGMMIDEIKTSRKAVAFTFDDGPNPEYTPQLMEIFRQHGGKATFYVIGEQVVKHPELAQALASEGHELGNHTFTHPFLTKLSADEQRVELEKTARIIEETAGSAPATFRPPYIDIDETVFASVGAFGYPSLGAVNMAAEDWNMPGVEHIVRESRAQVRPGAVLIFHDGFGDRSQSIEAVRTLVPELVAQGYELVTVSELLSSAD